MTPREALAAMRARCDAATPGPWRKVDIGDEDDEACVMSEHTAITDGCKDGEVNRRDAAFIAAARTDLPKLLAVAEAALRARNAEAAFLADLAKFGGVGAERAEEEDAADAALAAALAALVEP